MPEIKPGEVALIFREGDTVGESLDVIWDLPDDKLPSDPVPPHFHACAAIYNYIATDPDRMRPIMDEYFQALNDFTEGQGEENENTESQEEEVDRGERETSMD